MLASKKKTYKKKKAKKCLEQGKQVNITVIMNGILCSLDKPYHQWPSEDHELAISDYDKLLM